MNDGMHPELLILDLDETLMHASEKPLTTPHDFKVGPYVVYKRPGLDAFLRACAEHYTLAVWTSASLDYAITVAAHLFPDPGSLAFVWARDRCTARVDPERRETVWIKDLRKVKRKGYRLEQMLVVDDSPEKLARQYGNLVPVPPFFGDPDDVVLPLLGAYLGHLAGVENVRRIEKRYWLSRRQSNGGSV